MCSSDLAQLADGHALHPLQDLPGDKPSGLKEAMKVLKGVEGVSICQLGKADVVRHVMVQRIIEAYARFEEKKK